MKRIILATLLLLGAFTSCTKYEPDDSSLDAKKNKGSVVIIKNGSDGFVK